VGFLSAGLSYASRIHEARLSLGVGVWVAWEPPSTFDHNVFEARGATLFLRAALSPSLHADVGPAFLRYSYADDCSSCNGTFVGVRASVRWGGRKFFPTRGSAGRAIETTGAISPPWVGDLQGSEVRYQMGSE
jgi:hypothetical protein